MFADMTASSFFNFSFLPKYGQAVIQGVEYTLILSVVSVLMAVLPAFLLATMRLSKNKIIRCVGNPDKRSNEDGLRILRALRFSSVLGFSIEKETEKSIRKTA